MIIKKWYLIRLIQPVGNLNPNFASFWVCAVDNGLKTVCLRLHCLISHCHSCSVGIARFVCLGLAYQISDFGSVTKLGNYVFFLRQFSGNSEGSRKSYIGVGVDIDHRDRQPDPNPHPDPNPNPNTDVAFSAAFRIA